MARSDERVSKALAELEALRAKEKEDALEREKVLYSALPRVKEIDDELHAIGPNAIRYYLNSGERDKNKLKEHLQSENLRLRSEKKALMLAAGFEEDFASIHYSCPLCKDTGFIDGQHCRCLDQKLIRMNYETSNLGSVLRHQNFDAFDLSRFPDMSFKKHSVSPRQNMALISQKAMRYVEAFPESDPHNLYFFGSAGTGKTFLCSCIAKEIMDRGFTVLYLSADDLSLTLEKSRFVAKEQGNIELNQQVQLIRSCDLLIIDDLGTEVRSTLSANLLLNCLNQRLTNNKATIISSNLTIPELSEKYSERMSSRILGDFLVCELYGPDQRLNH